MPETKQCARAGCTNVFEPRRHWQIYCSKECNRLAYWARSILDEEAPTRKITRKPWTSEEQQPSIKERVRLQKIVAQAELHMGGQSPTSGLGEVLDIKGICERCMGPTPKLHIKICPECAAKENSI